MAALKPIIDSRSAGVARLINITYVLTMRVLEGVSRKNTSPYHAEERSSYDPGFFAEFILSVAEGLRITPHTPGQ
jgi:hypothetical protein